MTELSPNPFHAFTQNPNDYFDKCVLWKNDKATLVGGWRHFNGVAQGRTLPLPRPKVNPGGNWCIPFTGTYHSTAEDAIQQMYENR